MINQEYKERVRLLLRIIPIISTEECFAVHGGTAINLFVQNLPRYSVDIDLTYIPVEPREASLAHIKERLKEIKAKIEATIPGIAVREVPNKLICTHNGHFVKVEVNDVKRGIIAPPVELPLCDLAQEDFGVFCKARIVPLSQLYGGKITAALDRQHPRDLFDVNLMLDYIKDFDEIKRVLVGLQTVDRFNVALPADWHPGDEAIVPTASSSAAAEERMTRPDEGTQCYDWFFCTRPLPQEELEEVPVQ